MSGLIPFPGRIGETIRLNCKGAVADKPSLEPMFRVGDVCSFPPFDYTFRVERVDDDHVDFERVS